MDTICYADRFHPARSLESVLKDYHVAFTTNPLDYVRLLPTHDTDRWSPLPPGREDIGYIRGYNMMIGDSSYNCTVVGFLVPKSYSVEAAKALLKHCGYIPVVFAESIGDE